MAEIPVENKSSGFSWLWWLFLLAGIAALLYAIFDNDDDTPDILQEDETAMVAPVEGDMDADAAIDADTAVDADANVNADATGALTGLAMLGGLTDKVGRDVNLQGVAVNEVVGDESFTIGEGDNETLVIFSEERTPNTAQEGNVDVNPGSRVNIVGTVRAKDGSFPASVSKEVADDTQAYIFGSDIDVVE